MFTVKDSEFGKGLFASQDIKKGSIILEFSGPLVSFEESKNPQIESYCVQIGYDRYIFPNIPERFANHSCEPNSGFSAPNQLIAIRDIEEGEEILFDYSTCMDEDHWTMACRCGTKSCRTVIKDFKYVPLETQKKYIELKIIPSWMRIPIPVR